MHIKFINRGTGSATSAKEYLLQEHDHKGEIRAGVKVLRGNPEHVTQLAESLEFKHKYTSGVIAWHEEDNPTSEQINEVLNDFERVAFAGLDGNQYCYYAVLHEENNGAKHIHIITPRVELTTGKSMNIAPPNWQKTYDVVRDKHNTQHGWASPKEIARQKTMAIDKMQIHADTPNTQAKKMIHELINELVKRGSIKNNSDIRTKLAEFGEITREGKDYISLKPKGFKKAIRLKGAYYGREFSIERVSEEVRREQEQRAGANKEDRSREYERVSRVLEDIIAERAKFNRGRYGHKAKHTKRQGKQSKANNDKGRESYLSNYTQESRNNRGGEQKPNAKLHQNQDENLASSVNNGLFSDIGINTRELRPWELGIKPTNGTPRNKRSDEQGEKEERADRKISFDKRNLHEWDRIEKQTPDLAKREWKLGSAIRKRERAINDRARKRVEANIADTTRNVQERVRRSNKAVHAGFEIFQVQLQSDNRKAAEHYRKSEPNIKRVRESKSEYRDTLRRQSGDSLNRAGAELENPFGAVKRTIAIFGKARRGLNQAIKQCLSKAITKVEEIAKKAYSHSFGMSR